MELQPGDIILFKGKGFISKMVQFFTKSNYTHAAMMISDKQMIEANWYKKVNIVDFIYDVDIMEVYRYKEKLDINQTIQIVQNSYTMLDKYYDYSQVISYVFEFFLGKHFNNPFNLGNFIICSELIDKSYKFANIDLVPSRMDGNVTPGDLSKSLEIIKIY